MLILLAYKYRSPSKKHFCSKIAGCPLWHGTGPCETLFLYKLETMEAGNVTSWRGGVALLRMSLRLLAFFDPGIQRACAGR